MAQFWTKQKVLDEIQVLYRTEGRINSHFVRTHHWCLINAAISHFGNWENAVTAAGFSYSQIKKKGGKRMQWTRERIISRIHEILVADGKVNYQHAYKISPVLCTSAASRFGSWGKAVEAAGLSYDQIRARKPYRSWNKDRILNEIKRRQNAQLGIDHETLRVEDEGLLAAIYRHVGKGGRAKAVILANSLSTVVHREQAEKYFSEFGDKLLEHCVSKLRDQAKAEDVVQEVFIRTLQYLVSGKKIYDAKGFLFNTARYVILGTYRKRKESSLDQIEGDYLHPESDTDKEVLGQRMDVIRQYVNRLGKTYRRLLRMRYFEGRSIRLIAKEMGMSEEMVWVRIGRALDKVRKMFVQ